MAKRYVIILNEKQLRHLRMYYMDGIDTEFDDIDHHPDYGDKSFSKEIRKHHKAVSDRIFNPVEIDA